METGYIKYLTDNEFNIIDEESEVYSVKLNMAINLMAYLGLRVSDVINLKVSNFHKNYSVLQYIDKKTKVFQQKPVPDFFRSKILNYIRDHDPKDYFLTTKFGTRYKSSTIRWFFVKLRIRHNWDKPYYINKNGHKYYRISPHTLKHYCLNKVYHASGNDMIFVKNFSGHKEMKHTIRYIEKLNSFNQASNILEKAFAC